MDFCLINKAGGSIKNEIFAKHVFNHYTSPAGILWIENLETVILSEVFLW
jgi:ABC-type dipeptide/oligopeptide/nickel transport system permease subunit